GVMRAGEVLALGVGIALTPTKHFFAVWKNKYVRWALLTLVMWMLFQGVSDVYNRTPLENVKKGFANLILSCSTLVFLTILFQRKSLLVLQAFMLGRVFGGLFLYDYIDASDEILSNEFWDVRIAPWAGGLVTLLAISFANRFKTVVAFSLLIYGTAAIAFGGRAHGMPFCVAFLGLFFAPRIKSRFRKVTKKSAIRLVVVSSLALAVLYPSYIYIAQQGLITSKAREQVAKMDNPYNPIEAVLSVRAGLAYGFDGICRRPWIGYGSRTISGEFVPLQATVGFQREYNFIHSRIFESWVSGGIGCGVCCLVLLWIVLKRCFDLYSSTDPRCQLMAAIYATSNCWAFVASTLPGMRLSYPVVLAVLIAIDPEELFVKSPKVYQTSMLPPLSSNTIQRAR
ncbi:MAG: hypothetical protein AAGA30_10630, partial [Planctomycetota bacterium]